MVVQNRWRDICPNCFDAEAEFAGRRYQFVGMAAASWNDKAEPAKRCSKRRR